MKKVPGILNDVIGPVMRGPSSSHTAASWRIARSCLDILNEPLKRVIIEFDKDSAWAGNYLEQGTVMGINGGLLGIDITDSHMKDTELIAEEKDISICYETNSFPTNHSNTIRLSLESVKGKTKQVVAASIGGGSFEIQQIEGFKVSIFGDYYELLISSTRKNAISDILKSNLPKNLKLVQSIIKDRSLINIKSPEEFSAELLNRINLLSFVENVVVIYPVLPVISGNESEIPFTDIESLQDYAVKKNLDLGDIGLIYEGCLSGFSDALLKERMKHLIRIIETSIQTGLQGTVYKNRILQQQSHLIDKARNSGKILQQSIVNDIVANVTAIMESKSAMEVVVANPTAGSCGAVGGVLKAVADELISTTDELIKAYFAAGLVGAYFAQGPGFSAEEHGCQVECGAASGMAAAGIVQLLGGSLKQALDAASLAIQNMIGLVCDPVADRVEVPCLGKNINAAVNALSSATMASSGYDAVIPLDEVIKSIPEVSKLMPDNVKCTGKGGLAVTATARLLKERLAGNGKV